MAPAILIPIAVCESGITQFNPDGTVFQGKVDPDDTGIFQINKRYHLAKAKSMGYDINTTRGNIAYALYLYRTQGTKPWDASKACWKPVSSG